MFSPYYAAARRRGPADPRNHCALNVALYSTGKLWNKHWSLTERPATSLVRSIDTLQIGPSALHWDNGNLIIDIDELAVPRFTRLRGRVTLSPQIMTDCINPLAPEGGHHWWPIAPIARASVAMETPGMVWSGSAYLDSNWGARALETDFTRWTWSRSDMGAEAAVLYDAQPKNSSAVSLAYRFKSNGSVQAFEPPPVSVLPKTGWRMERATRSEDQARIVRTLEDTPFYARSIIENRLFGTATRAVHESLSLDKFATRWVQTLLPFRAPRARR